MIWSTPIIKDATIYEMDPFRNSGLDPILELRKQGSTTNADLKESRVLVQFDLMDLNSVLSNAGVPITSASAYLKLHSAQLSNMPDEYTIVSRPVSYAWKNGSGYGLFQDTTLSTDTSDGVTWVKTSGKSSWEWKNVPGQLEYYTVEGGGAWLTGSTCSQSFSFKSDDTLYMNVTDTVRKMYNSTITNNGLILSFDHAQLSGSMFGNPNLQFYSCDTATVYAPQLVFEISTPQTYNTGSLAVLTDLDSPVLGSSNFKALYSKNLKHRVYITARPKFPKRAFSQSVYSLYEKCLPQNTYYQIRDAINGDIIVPFSTFTKVNTLENISYFDFYATMLYAERYYRFDIKCVYDGGIERIYSPEDFIFKVIL